MPKSSGTILRLACVVLATLQVAQARAVDQEEAPTSSTGGTKQVAAHAPEMRPRVGIRTPEPSAAHPATAALTSFLKGRAHRPAPPTARRGRGGFAGSARSAPTAGGSGVPTVSSATGAGSGVPTVNSATTANAAAMGSSGDRRTIVPPARSSSLALVGAPRASATPAKSATLVATLNKSGPVIGGPHAPTSVVGGAPPAATVAKAARIDGTAMRRKF